MYPIGAAVGMATTDNHCVHPTGAVVGMAEPPCASNWISGRDPKIKQQKINKKTKMMTKKSKKSMEKEVPMKKRTNKKWHLKEHALELQETTNKCQNNQDKKLSFCQFCKDSNVPQTILTNFIKRN